MANVPNAADLFWPCTMWQQSTWLSFMQVEYAATEYQLPRLTKMWTHLERQSGAGKMKGMGEKQIDVDRRLLRSRLATLRGRLEEACSTSLWCSDNG